MIVTEYTVFSKSIQRPLKIALASDVHNRPQDQCLERMKDSAPDLILIPGDLTDDEHINRHDSETLSFLRQSASIAPTFYSLGNHEIACYHRGNPFRKPMPQPIPSFFRDEVSACGAVLLDNESTVWNGLRICGLTSGIHGSKNEPDPAVIRSFRDDAHPRILLCHHPEYYFPYLQRENFELVVSGHAHGGQWRIFNHGIYAPGQGLFPKYTSGVLDGTCVISRGLGDHTRIPRIFNSRELVLISLLPKQD